MKKSTIILLAGSLAAVGIAFYIGRRTGPDAQHLSESAPAIAEESTTWTCSMHPQIQVPDPGDCPICGMDLIPAGDAGSGESRSASLHMSATARELADIRTTLVRRDFPEMQISLVGRLEYDQTRVQSLSARFPARIEQLFVNYRGAPVKQGEHLARIFSPELSSAQQELLLAYKADPEGSLTRASREKLRLWDLMPSQIEGIIQSGEPSDEFELLAPTSGVVIEKQVNEGDYVEKGQPLLTIADLSKLWLMLDAYESDLPWLRYGQTVNFTVQAFPGQVFTGRIALFEPELDRQSRTVRIRVNVDNVQGELKPGMFAKGIVDVKVAEGGRVHAPDLAGKWISPMHPEIVKDGPGSCDVCGMDLVPAETMGYVELPQGEAPLVIPTSAVLRTGKRAVVYVESETSEDPTFEGREITLGPRAGNVFLVEAGLEENARVVTNGAFKIDSALQIQARPSMMSMESSREHEEMNMPTVQSQVELAKTVIDDYFRLQDAMAKDDYESSRAALMVMMEKTGHHGPLPDLIHEMLATTSMEELRRPLFDTMSQWFIATVKEDPAAFEGSIFQMSCPMVYRGRNDNSADWLQNHDELLNPFWGSMMLHCGATKEKLR